MDFVVIYTLINAVITRLVLSYDIVCQWCRNFGKRNLLFPPFMRIPDWVFNKTQFVIPKFHIYGHGSSCQFRYSLNFLKWSARTNGEDIERWWAHINPLSMSTKEMGPGSRHDTIDDHAAAWNWRKIVGLGEFRHIYLISDCYRHSLLSGVTLLAQLEKGLQMQARHTAFFTRFSRRFDPAVIQQWEEMVKAWDADNSKPNPYADSVTRE
jgi:Kyakuja-Dileera-Zisupton transposase